MEEALHDALRSTASLRGSTGMGRHPTRTSSWFRRLLEVNDLARRSLATVNAMLSARGLLLKRAPPSMPRSYRVTRPKNKDGARDEIRKTKRQSVALRHESAYRGRCLLTLGLVHTVIRRSQCSRCDQMTTPCCRQELSAHDAQLQGTNKRPNARQDIRYRHATGQASLNKANAMSRQWQKIEKLKSQRARQVEHRFGDQTPVRARQSALQGLKKNTAQLRCLR
jgi:IS5 family transposase